MSRNTPFSSTPTREAELLELSDPVGNGGRLVLRAADDDVTEDTRPSLDFDTDASEAPTQNSPWLMIASSAMAALWAGGAGAFLLGYAQTGAFKEASTPLLAGLGAVAVGPVAFLLLAGAMGEALRRASRDAKALTAAAARISRPGPEAERAAHAVATAVRREIDTLEAAITATLNRLAAVEGGVAQRAAALVGAGTTARDSAAEVTRVLGEGVHLLTAAAQALAEQAGEATGGHESRANALLNSARIADAAAREAAELLGVRARDILAISKQSAQATTSHAASLEAASQRLDAAALRAATNAATLVEAVAQADAALARAAIMFSGTRSDLAGTAQHATETALALKASSEQAADETSRLVAIGKSARDDASIDAEQRLEHLQTALTARAGEMIVALRAEVEAARIASEEGLLALQRTADIARVAAISASAAANAEADSAEKRLQALGETAFEAGKRADTVTEARLSEARALVERSVDLLSVAGDRITARFAATAAACSEQTLAVEALLAGLQATQAGIPAQAAEHSRAIEMSLEASLARLNQAGRGALEEAAQIDEAFQARLRESYTALGDIVARLGGFAGLAGAIPPPPLRPLHPIAINPPREAAALPLVPVALPPEAVPSPQPIVPNEGSADALPATPAPADDALFDAEFRKAGGAVPSEREGWRWKDLLATLDAGKSGDNSEPRDDLAILKRALSGLGLGSTGIMTDAAIARIGVAGALRADSRRKAVRQYAPEGLKLMTEQVRDSSVHDAALRFVQHHQDAASRNALNDELTALYLLADAALAS